MYCPLLSQLLRLFHASNFSVFGSGAKINLIHKYINQGARDRKNMAQFNYKRVPINDLLFNRVALCRSVLQQLRSAGTKISALSKKSSHSSFSYNADILFYRSFVWNLAGCGRTHPTFAFRAIEYTENRDFVLRISTGWEANLSASLSAIRVHCQLMNGGMIMNVKSWRVFSYVPSMFRYYAFHVFRNLTIVIVPRVLVETTHVDLTFFNLAAPLINKETNMTTTDVTSVVS
jgi:hypothetical protein